MHAMARTLSLIFAAGALGAVANSAALWAAGEFGVTSALDVAIAPAFTLAWLHPRVVWGGVWGLVFLLPLDRTRWLARGLVVSLAPSLVQLFVVFPVQTQAGIAGLGLGTLTPLVVLVANAVWGVAASWWLRLAGR